MENVLGIFQNAVFSLSPVRTIRGFFLALHQENLLEFLEVKSSKVSGIPKTMTIKSFLFWSYSTLSLQPFVKIVSSISISVWFQQILFQVSWSHLWFSVFTYVSRFLSGSLLSDFNCLMSPRKVIDIFVFFFVLVKNMSYSYQDIYWFELKPKSNAANIILKENKIFLKKGQQIKVQNIQKWSQPC